VLGVRRWSELATEKNGGILFDRPKPAAGSGANGRKVSVPSSRVKMFKKGGR
jgi:hypothetical protein